MTNRTITLRDDLVDRFEKLAAQQGRSLDELFGELLDDYAPSQDSYSALDVAPLPDYDDDPKWNKSFAESQDFLARMAHKIRREYDEGRTVELDFDDLERDDQ